MCAAGNLYFTTKSIGELFHLLPPFNHDRHERNHCLRQRAADVSSWGNAETHAEFLTHTERPSFALSPSSASGPDFDT